MIYKESDHKIYLYKPGTSEKKGGSMCNDARKNDNLTPNPFPDPSAPTTLAVLLFSTVPTLRLSHQQRLNKDV